MKQLREPARLLALTQDARWPRCCWPRPSVSDGVTPYRIVRITARVRVCGRIWSIDDQVLHTFRLDVERGDEITWTLYVDPDVTALGARRARNILDLIAGPGEAPWVHTLTGTERRAP